MRAPAAALFLSLSIVCLSAAACSEGTGEPEEAAAVEEPSPFEDPELARIHGRMMETMAPDRGWERARYIRFDWVVDRGEGEPSRRFHRWDRYTGEYRLEAPADGGTMVALFNVNRPQEGRVWIDGGAVEGERKSDLLDRAHAVFINDTYWLLMPYKWDDPGVHAEYMGQETDGEGRSWEVVQLSFEEDVGRTPENVYRAYVSPESGLMERWHHYRTEGVEPLVSDWENWHRVGPIMLADSRPLGGGRTIRFENLVVSEQVPPGAFEPPPGAPGDSAAPGNSGAPGDSVPPGDPAPAAGGSAEDG